MVLFSGDRSIWIFSLKLYHHPPSLLPTKYKCKWSILLSELWQDRNPDWLSSCHQLQQNWWIRNISLLSSPGWLQIWARERGAVKISESFMISHREVQPASSSVQVVSFKLYQVKAFTSSKSSYWLLHQTDIRPDYELHECCSCCSNLVLILISTIRLGNIILSLIGAVSSAQSTSAVTVMPTVVQNRGGYQYFPTQVNLMIST